ncbi:hypothetical protein [Streptomyces sp. BK79]|uniref:hypothetical protein n=1 Tax=Streptomyces sp. BK79 TaxID=3350097 RepID=UPI00376FCAFA
MPRGPALRDRRLGGCAAYRQLDGNLATTGIDSRLAPAAPSARPFSYSAPTPAAGANSNYDAHISGARSDTTMLLHVVRAHEVRKVGVAGNR